MSRCFCQHIERCDSAARLGRVVAFPNRYPTNLRQTLVVPLRCVERLCEHGAVELEHPWLLAATVRRLLQEQLSASDSNPGINDGAIAVQAVPHVHLHVVSPVNGDAPNPTDDVRRVVPWKPQYRSLDGS